MSSEEVQQIHKGSRLLSYEENLKIFSLIEPKFRALQTALVQAYLPESPDNTPGIEYGTGVLCLIRNGNTRSYFLRLYCPTNDNLIWEYELRVCSKNENYHFYMTFDWLVNIIGINFASDNEAQAFYRIITKIKLSPHSGEKARQPVNKSAEAQENVFEKTPPVTLRNVKKPPEQPDNKNPFGTDRSRVQHKPGLNKNIIGSPSNFVHVFHLGHDEDRRFNTHGETEIIDQFNIVNNEHKLENDSNETTGRRNNNHTKKLNKTNKLMSSKTTAPRQTPSTLNKPAPILTGTENPKSFRKYVSIELPPPPPPPPPATMGGSNGPSLAPPPPSQQRQHIEAVQDHPINALLDSILNADLKANIVSINFASNDDARAFYCIINKTQQSPTSEEEAIQPVNKSAEDQKIVYEEIPPLRETVKAPEESDTKNLLGPDRSRDCLIQNIIGSQTNSELGATSIAFDEDRCFDSDETVIGDQVLKKADGNDDNPKI